MRTTSKFKSWHRWALLFSVAFGLSTNIAPWRVMAEERTRSDVQSPEKQLPLPGEVLRVKGHTAFLMLPAQKRPRGATPWVLYAPTLPGLPGNEEKWMFEKFLDAGIAVAGIDVGESFGSHEGRDLYTAFLEKLVQERGLSKQACRLARSRGGLMLFNWAADHPSSVACIAGIYPVCNLKSYPGLKTASDAYGLKEEQLATQLAEFNPIERLEPLAKAHIPIFHIHGDSDVVVPLEDNSGEVAKRYEQLGGEMTLKVVKGQGHNMWPGWFQSQELVDFVIAHAKEKDRPDKSEAGDGK